jgi:hypothetical protein
MRKTVFTILSFVLCATGLSAHTTIKDAVKINPTTVEVRYNDGRLLTVDFYGDNIVRLYRDDKSDVMHDPEAAHPARILTQNPRRNAGTISISQSGKAVSIASRSIRLDFDCTSTLLAITDLRTGRTVLSEKKPVSFAADSYRVTLAKTPNEYFYGGGVQNGRFSHAGHRIEIVNTNSWTDGGVSSPAPFYWSTAGYAVLCHTFAPGAYDFGEKDSTTVVLTHRSDYSDLFVMVDSKPEALLNDYYQLTGNPVLLPKFGFYEGHLNAYNRDYWKETTPGKGIRFEDGKWYTESQKDNGGIRESLNGENNNYPFSARAVVDRYAQADMPLGWVLPNDGYGAGYGQTNSLDGNIANLKAFGDYARSKGVEIGLWTQSQLHPIDRISPLLQRDIIKEVRDAGVRVLKTDVAWVGEGYSFGLNGITDVAQVMPYYGNGARPFIITLDGWAGTQRYAGVWTGDQKGGNWEYIRFHIPTYIGAGLSGLGNVTSDMDGIFGGRNLQVNVRDFEWKTFTPMQLNMDGWGSNPKYPQALGEPATSINRNYLKLKSMLLPYTYSCAFEATHGKPLMRAMMLEAPNAYTFGEATRYQYMFGPSLLVAPIYQATAMKEDGSDIRDGVYLPDGVWYDYFSGEPYQGGRIYNNLDVPLWKIPVFAKAGAIIPMANASNNVHQIDHGLRIFEVYPGPGNAFTLYDDDGTTEAYKHGAYSTTLISTSTDSRRQQMRIVISPSEGHFDGMETRQRTELRVNTWGGEPKGVTVKVNGKKFGGCQTRYEEQPELNRFSTPNSDAAKLSVKKNAQLVIDIPALDITADRVEVTVDGCRQALPLTVVEAPGHAVAAPEVKATAYSLTPKWQPDSDARYREIRFGGMTYTNIRGDSLVFDGLKPNTRYDFEMRKVGDYGAGLWTTFSATTGADPTENALHGLTATLTGTKDMDGFGVAHLFDFAESGDIWHTDYYSRAVPFTLNIDLHQTAQLDRIVYVPRQQGSNGRILDCTLSVSADGKTWTDEGRHTWSNDATKKTVVLADKPTARYLRLAVSQAVGDFGSGSELYVMKEPGTKTVIAGDINQDGVIDANDLTSYMNYTGLRKGDPDFDGYISKGDLNGNGIIDVADISEVATQLEGGISDKTQEKVDGAISLKANKPAFNAGDEVVVTVAGTGLKAVNGVGLNIPYPAQTLQFEKVEPMAVSQMANLTNNRTHHDGTTWIYPTFVNLGEKPTLSGSQTLFTLHFKALRKGRLNLEGVKKMLVDRQGGTKNE